MSEILVIEDDIEFCDILCKVLDKKGYEVFSATNGQDGLALYKARSADLVITDILLPDRDGIHLILDLQKIYPNVKIIAISGGGHCATGPEYLDDIQLLCKIDHTLSKPFKKDELFEMIQEILRE